MHLSKPDLDRLLNKALQAPSFGEDCMNRITVPYAHSTSRIPSTVPMQQITVPFQIVSTRTGLLRLLANISLQKFRRTEFLTFLESIKFISVSFTTAIIERLTSFFEIVKVPRTKILSETRLNKDN